MKPQKLCLLAFLAAPLLVPGAALAEGRTSTGYLSSVTYKSLVLDGVSYRFRPTQEELNPVRVKCLVKNVKIDCEELTEISQRNRARAKVSFDKAGFPIRVQLLDELK